MTVGAGDTRSTKQLLLTTGEAAKVLKISPKTLTGHVKDGSLKYVNVGRGTIKPRRMFPPAELEDFTQRRMQQEIPCRSTGRKGSPFYHYDFQMRGRRFHGSTESKSRRERRSSRTGRT